jgi:hypothetical protein
MKYNKEDFERLINVEKISYREIGRLYGISDAYVKKLSKRLGVILPVRAKFPQNFVPANKGQHTSPTYKAIICKNCEKIIFPSTWNRQQFCDKYCAGEYKSKKVYENYLLNPDKYCRASYSPAHFKKFILIEQNNKCAMCGLDNIWNDKILIFILDHIDGDASNNRRENIRMVCPNCDSQLDTYKSKNKNSARKERYLLMKK